MQGGMMGGGDSGQDASIPEELQTALEAITRAYQKETDPLDKEKIGRIMSMIDALFAQEQKDKDQALGGGGSMRMLRRNR